MTANASDYRDLPTRADLADRADAALGCLIERLMNDNAHRYGRTLRTLNGPQRDALYGEIAPMVFGWVTAVDSDDVQRWIELARAADRGVAP